MATIISLGSTCSVAYHLDQARYPWDWNRVDTLSQITEVLKNNFDNYWDLKVIGESDKFALLEDEFKESTTNNRTITVQNSYGIKFYHDFTSLLDLDTVKIKYSRRITRFYEALLGHKMVHFVRDELKPATLTQAMIVDFIRTLLLINPKLNWRLTIILFNPKKVLEIEEYKDKVRIIVDNGKFGGWKREFLDWGTIFKV
jgi:hypothetical protein